MMGQWFDEVEEGQHRDLGSYHFTRDAILAFARAYDPQSFHVDDAAAKASHFGGLIASGWHTASAWMKCYVAAHDRACAERAAQGAVLPEVGPSPGFTDLKWLRPVYVDDRVSYTSAITAKRELASKPRWGLVMAHNAGMNQHGDTVFSFEGKVLVARR